MVHVSIIIGTGGGRRYLNLWRFFSSKILFKFILSFTCNDTWIALHQFQLTDIKIKCVSLLAYNSVSSSVTFLGLALCVHNIHNIINSPVSVAITHRRYTNFTNVSTFLYQKRITLFEVLKGDDKSWVKWICNAMK